MILVVKLSGKVLEEEARLHLCRQIGELNRRGHRIVVVHGGGKQLTEVSARLGIPVVQYQGRRVTDEGTLQVAKMVLSAINCDLTAGLIADGVGAIGISGFDGKLVQCHKRPPVPVTVNGSTRTVDFGFVGDIDRADPGVLFQLWELGFLPVVSCLCADSRGQILNLNADTVASELAVALRVRQLISVSDVEGIYLDARDPSTRVPELDAEQAQRYLREGCLTDGMALKVEAALKVLKRGVTAVQIVSGLKENALLEGLEGREGTRLVCSKRSRLEVSDCESPRAPSSEPGTTSLS